MAAAPTAVEAATGELVAPIVGSTLTTVVVFAPLGLLQGVVGDFFKALSITLSVAVLISLVLALTLDPAARAGMAYRAHPDRGARRTTSDRGGRRSIGSTSRTLRRCLGRAGSMAALVALVARRRRRRPLYLRRRHGLPAGSRRGRLRHRLLTPPGSALERDRRADASKVEAILRDTPEVASFVRRTGSELGMFATQQNSGDILVRLKPRGQRDRSAEEIIDDLREQGRRRPSRTPTSSSSSCCRTCSATSKARPNPIEVKIFGDDQSKLDELSEHDRSRSSRRSAASSTSSASQRGRPEVTWQVDPVAAGRLGLTVEAGRRRSSSNAWLGDVATESAAARPDDPGARALPGRRPVRSARRPDTPDARRRTGSSCRPRRS